MKKKYEDIRDNMESGDVLACKRRNWLSVLIRAGTAESVNHVAMVIVNGAGVWVIEMREGKGNQMMPCSQWLDINSNAVITYGEAPEEVRGHVCIEVEAMKSRGKAYSWWTLPFVFLSQLFLAKVPTGLVCSTFIQKVWESCGYKMSNKAADPGDFLEHLSNRNTISL